MQIIVIIFSLISIGAVVMHFFARIAIKSIDRKRKDKFYETGNIMDLSVEDITDDDELRQYVLNPDKHKELLDKINLKNKEKRRQDKLDQLLGNEND